MTPKELRGFLDKSGLTLSRVAREAGVSRTLASYFVNGYKDIAWEHKVKLKKFVEGYKQSWLGDK